VVHGVRASAHLTCRLLTQQTAFSATSVADPQTCVATGQPANCTLQINNFIASNPNLGSEQSEQFSLGVAFAPFDWFTGTLDYSNIEITNRIRAFSASNLLSMEAAGDPLPPGLQIVRASSGAIIRIDSGFGNEGNVNTSFFDLNLRSQYGLFAGRMFHNLNVVRLQTQSVDGGRQTVRDPGVPQHRAVLENRYAWGDFSFAYNLNYISGQCNTMSAGQFENQAICNGRAPSWTTHDAQVNYFTPWNGRITVGAQNLWNRQPAIGRGAFGSRDYDFDLYDGFGRTTYVRYTQSF
jgi:iron complex outermembrane recepter protein